MHRDRHRNWDHFTLAGDHSVSRVRGGKLADRLLHGTCNSHRQDGRYDAHRPVLVGIHPRDWLAHMRTAGLIKDNAAVPAPTRTALAMDW